MIKPRSEHAESDPSDTEENLLVLELPLKVALQLEALAAKLEVTQDVLINEFMAKGLVSEGVSLTPGMVEYLEKHGRPIPPGAKLDPKPQLN